MENVMAYKLNPPRGKAQHALVTISAKTGNAFVVEQLQHLTVEEALAASNSLWKNLIVSC